MRLADRGNILKHVGHPQFPGLLTWRKLFGAPSLRYNKGKWEEKVSSVQTAQARCLGVKAKGTGLRLPLRPLSPSSQSWLSWQGYSFCVGAIISPRTELNWFIAKIIRSMSWIITRCVGQHVTHNLPINNRNLPQGAVGPWADCQIRYRYGLGCGYFVERIRWLLAHSSCWW